MGKTDWKRGQLPPPSGALGKHFSFIEAYRSLGNRGTGAHSGTQSSPAPRRSGRPLHGRGGVMCSNGDAEKDMFLASGFSQKYNINGTAQRLKKSILL